MDWKEYVTKTVRLYRQEFDKLSPDTKKVIRRRSFDDTLLAPCQIEVLASQGEVGCLVIHDEHVDDMQIEIREDIKTYGSSEFVKKYGFNIPPRDPLISQEYTVFFTMNGLFPIEGRPEPREMVEYMLSRLERDVVRETKVKKIRKTANELRESISKLPESQIRIELTEHAKMLDKALEEIKRIDKDIGGVRKLMGITKEYQDWKLLVSDVHRLKGEHVPREVFEAKVDELGTRIDSLSEIREAYDNLFAQQNQFMKQQSEVMKQQSSLLNWVKYSMILVPIVVACVPIIEVLIRHLLGIT